MRSLTDKEVIIDHLKSIEESLATGSDYNDGFADGVAFSRGFVETLESVGEWVPCKERMPDKYGDYLVCGWKWNTMAIAHYSNLMSLLNHSIFWQGDVGKFDFQNVTEYVLAWMPLPERYQGDIE